MAGAGVRAVTAVVGPVRGRHGILLNDWATLIWEHVSYTDIFGDALCEALERQGVPDPDTVSVERDTATVSDPADPLALSMGGDDVTGMVR